MKEAVVDGAARIGLGLGEVEYKLDLDHFRNEHGANVGADTVKVWVWPLDGQMVEASRSAREYVAGLVSNMGFEAKVTSQIRGDDVIIKVVMDNAGPLVGRRGVTLDAVRTLLLSTLGHDHPDFHFRLDVADNRPRDRYERRDSDDGERGRRPRDRDHGRRPRDRDRTRRSDDKDRTRRSDGRDRTRRSDDRDRTRRSDDRDRRKRRNSDSDERGSSSRLRQADEKKLRRMAEKVAKRVLSTGEPELIRKELNSFARRVVHITVAEFEGLRTESLGEGSHKQIRVVSVAKPVVEDTLDAGSE